MTYSYSIVEVVYFLRGQIRPEVFSTRSRQLALSEFKKLVADSPEKVFELTESTHRERCLAFTLLDDQGKVNGVKYVRTKL